MPKISIEFQCPEEHEELLTAIHAADYKVILGEISQWARSALKYGHEFRTPDEAIEHLKRIIIEGCNTRNVDVY